MALSTAPGSAQYSSSDLAQVLAELFDETGGPLTEHELAAARQRLALAQRH